ncbi:MAG: hypothetical protein Hals2KO_03790 [Halioglobus sp.]
MTGSILVGPREANGKAMSATLEDILGLVVELQGQLAFQEDALGKLDDALSAQQQEILSLRRQLELLSKRHREVTARLDAGDDVAPEDERPPHY